MRIVLICVAAALLSVLVFSCSKGSKGGKQTGATTGIESEPLETASASGNGFIHLTAAETGIDFSNTISDQGAIEMLSSVNSGLAVADYDGDGDLDVFLCGLSTPNKLFRNDGGFKFTDVTAEAGPGLEGGDALASGAVFADFDGDGNLDLYVCNRNAGDTLFMGNGKGKFSDETAKRGINNPGAGVAVAPFDADNDGDLDLYVTNYLNDYDRDAYDALADDYSKQQDIKVPENLKDKFYLDDFHIPRYRPDDDQFYLNDGAGNFTNATKQAGLQLISWSYQAQACDLTNDGFCDLYITSDLETPDHFMVNNGDGTFTNHTADMIRKTTMFGMGCDTGDINGDGMPDMFVADMKSRSYKRGKKQSGDMYQWRAQMLYEHPQPQMRNMLYINRGGGWMTEVAEMCGASASEWTWAARIADLDCDGTPELFTTSGMLRDAMDVDYKNSMKAMLKQGLSNVQLVQYKLEQPSYFTDNLIFASKPGDMSYSPVEGNWNMLDGEMGCGASLADLDGDGDMDIIVNNTNADVGVWRNDQAAGNRVTIDLSQPGMNPSAVGARVWAYCGDKVLERDVILSRGFATGESPRLYFGLGDAQKIDRLVIRWPDLKEQEEQDLAAGFHYTIPRREGLENWQPEKHDAVFSETDIPWQDNEKALGEMEYHREPLLPMGQSSLGAGAGMADYNLDGNLDVYFCGPAGEAGALLDGDGQGGFERSSAMNGLSNPESEEMAALWFEANGDGRPDLLVTCGGVESPAGSEAYRDRLYLNLADGFHEASLPTPNTSTAAAAAADFDGDGDLDLVICGSVVPGVYAKTAPSYVLLNDGAGHFSNAGSKAAAALNASGQITDAQFCDLDGDYQVELVVSRKWGPVEALKFENGAFRSAFTLTEAGWWQGMGFGDFDNDGDFDVIIANVGHNTKYHPKPGKPITLYANDFDGNGTRDLIEVKYRDDGCMLPGRGRSCSGYAINYIPQRFPTWASFADATLDDVYGEGLKAAERFDATQISSVLCTNEGGGKFTLTDLPGSAQWAPAFGVAVADFNGDGQLDAYLANNFYDTQPETGRWDTGYGVLLLGDGQGHFAPQTRIESGISIWGDGRTALAADVNNDGHPDLVASLSQGVPQLCLGQSGSTCSVVNVSGGAGNPFGCGAILEFTLKNGSKRVHCVEDGSGFNGSLLGPQLISLPSGEEVTESVVHWPDGTSEPFSLDSSGTTEVRKDAS